MARSRNIKPGFFKNYDLADAGPIAQLLFAGLWCLADRDGRLEDKPRLIKAEIFPYYDADVDGELTVIERLGFVKRYTHHDAAIIQILNFVKHQNPHHTEKASSLPAFDESSCVSHCSKKRTDFNGCLTVNSPLLNGGNPADSLIPDSLLLIPDSLIPETLKLIPLGSEGKKKPSATGNDAELQKACKQVWQQYSTAYYQRYQVEPVRNAKVNGQVKSFVKRIGYDNAPHVAAHFVSSNTAYYVSRGHSVDCLLSDAEKLHTEWATGKSITQTRARQIDKSESNKNAVSEAIQILKDRGI